MARKVSSKPHIGSDYTAASGSKIGAVTRANIFINSQDKRARLMQPKQNNATTRRITVMNYALCSIEADFGPFAGAGLNTFRSDLHPDRCADYTPRHPTHQSRAMRHQRCIGAALHPPPRPAVYRQVAIV